MRLPIELEKKLSGSNQEPTSLSFDMMVNQFRNTFSNFPDKRTGTNTRYSMEDIGLSAFSVFFTQSPSFLAFQTEMQKNKGVNNARSLFGVKKIPSDNHIRKMLDIVTPETLFPSFHFIFDKLESGGYLEDFRSYNDNLLCALDGVQYYSSNKIHCNNCNTKEHKNGSISYSHTAITPVLVKPGGDKAISLPPEFITPQDGHKKQDCENAATKRWLDQFSPRYKELCITILGDDLYCKQSICELILQHELDFILVCKPDSHKTLYQWVEKLDGQTVVENRWDGKERLIDTYRFVNQVPLRDGEDALKVNWCELITTRQDGTIVYKNAFATNFEISKDNVRLIIRDGRTRWKIENENNNILKNQGYHFSHNFGHGSKYLSQLMATINILAFLFHTVLAMTDKKYQWLRANLRRRKAFFDGIRVLTQFFYFESWDKLLSLMIQGRKKRIVLDTS